MRVLYIAFAILTVLGVAIAIGAHAVVASDRTNFSEPEKSLISLRHMGELGGLRPLIGSAAGQKKQRDHILRLAQQGEPVSTGNPSVAPLKWVGKISTPAPTRAHPNEMSECTGQFIAPNVVLTAAHCLRDLPDNPTGPWYDLTKQTFTLQYQAGIGSRTFKTICGLTNPLWTVPSNFSSLAAAQQNDIIASIGQHDFAMILVDGNSPTGVMPYELDWKGKVTNAVKVGYAGDILEDEVIQQSAGIVFFADDIPMFEQPLPNLVVQWQGITDFTDGSSGGAWVANFSTDEGSNRNLLIAVTSFANDNYPGATFAAYLTAAEFNPLIKSVLNGCK